MSFPLIYFTPITLAFSLFLYKPNLFLLWGLCTFCYLSLTSYSLRCLCDWFLQTAQVPSPLSSLQRLFLPTPLGFSCPLHWLFLPTPVTLHCITFCRTCYKQEFSYLLICWLAVIWLCKKNLSSTRAGALPALLFAASLVPKFSAWNRSSIKISRIKGWIHDLTQSSQ